MTAAEPLSHLGPYASPKAPQMAALRYSPKTAPPQSVLVCVRLRPRSRVNVGPKSGKQKMEPAVREVNAMQMVVRASVSCIVAQFDDSSDGTQNEDAGRC